MENVSGQIKIPMKLLTHIFEGDVKNKSQIIGAYTSILYVNSFDVNLSARELSGLDQSRFAKCKRWLINHGYLAEEKNESKLSRKQRFGFIYLMSDGYEKYKKIGFAQDVSLREKELKTGNPLVQEIWRTKGSMYQEKFLHEIMKDKHFSLEWFDLTEEDVAYIKSEAWKEEA